MNTPWQDRFQAKISPEPNTGCWIWTAALDRYGYGVFVRRGKRVERAHRIAFELHHGRPPEGDLCHTCDHEWCISPYHTYEGDHSTNATDAVTRGQMPSGDSAPWSKLTSEAVRMARARYAAGGVTQQQLADEYGVCLTTMHDALHGMNWKCATGALGYAR